MGFLESLIYYGESIGKVFLCFFISIIIFSWYCHRQWLASRGKCKPFSKFKVIFYRTITVFPVAFMVGVRSYLTGADTYNMYKGYLRSGSVSLGVWLSENRTAPLYDIARWGLCRLTDGNVQVFLFLLAAITMYFVLAGIEKWQLKYSGTALFIFYCLFGLIMLDQSRQMVAVAILLYAFYYAYHGNMGKYIAFVFLAGVIHISAFAAGVATLFLMRRKLVKYKNLTYFALLAVICIILPWGISLIDDIFEGTKYAKYATIENTSIGWGLLLSMIPSVIPTLIFQKNMDSQYKMRDMVLITIPAKYAGYLSTFMSRMNYYFSGVGMIALPYAMEKSKRNRWICILVVYGCCVLYFVLWFWWKNAWIYLPYMTFWETGNPFIKL